MKQSRLVDLVLQYAHGSGDRRSIRAQAHALAKRSGAVAARKRLPASEIAQGVILFRRALLDSTLRDCTVWGNTENMQVMQRIDHFTDEFLVVALQAYSEEKGQRPEESSEHWSKEDKAYL